MYMSSLKHRIISVYPHPLQWLFLNLLWMRDVIILHLLWILLPWLIISNFSCSSWPSGVNSILWWCICLNFFFWGTGLSQNCFGSVLRDFSWVCVESFTVLEIKLGLSWKENVLLNYHQLAKFISVNILVSFHPLR